MGYDIYSRKAITKASEFGEIGEKAYFRASIGVAFIPRLVSAKTNVEGIFQVWENGISGDGVHHFEVDDCHAVAALIDTEEKRRDFVQDCVDHLFGLRDYEGMGLAEQDSWYADALYGNGIHEVASYINRYLDYIIEVADLGGADAC